MEACTCRTGKETIEYLPTVGRYSVRQAPSVVLKHPHFVPLDGSVSDHDFLHKVIRRTYLTLLRKVGTLGSYPMDGSKHGRHHSASTAHCPLPKVRKGVLAGQSRRTRSHGFNSKSEHGKPRPTPGQASAVTGGPSLTIHLGAISGAGKTLLNHGCLLTLASIMFVCVSSFSLLPPFHPRFTHTDTDHKRPQLSH